MDVEKLPMDAIVDIKAEERAWRRENGVASDSDEWSDDDDSVEGPDEQQPQPLLRYLDVGNID